MEMLGTNPNFLGEERDTAVGLWGLPFHASVKWERSSPRDYIFETLATKNEDGSAKYPLTLSKTSLATKILFDKQRGDKPKAIGVEYLKGASTYGAGLRRNSLTPGELKRAFASREVIVSGGTFNSPQLLQLTGIGDSKDFDVAGIEDIADLPGVPCRRGEPDDPCYELWKQGTGPYMRPGYNTNALLMRSNFSLNGERDIFIFSVPGAFRGFWPMVQQAELMPRPNTAAVKMHPQNTAGYMKFRSADPTEQPEINFQLYEEGAETDLGALSEIAAWGRRVLREVEDVEPAEPPCSATGSDGRCEDGDGTSDQDCIREQTFGHHPSGTCAIGPKEDNMAVLDSRFRVHGVEGLRVVDASVFPRAPGAFPVIATFMVSQKASEVILEDAEALK